MLMTFSSLDLFLRRSESAAVAALDALSPGGQKTKRRFS
jgi:hypothetical protein